MQSTDRMDDRRKKVNCAAIYGPSAPSGIIGMGQLEYRE